MNPLFIKDFIWGLLYIAIQIVLIRHLRLSDVQADIFWLYLIYIAAIRDRTYTIFITGILAFFYDAMLDTWGLYMFSYTAALFIVHRFIPRILDNRLLTPQIALILFAVSIAANGIVAAMTNFVDIYSSDIFFWEILLGNSLYTALLGSFLYNFSSATQGNS